MPRDNRCIWSMFVFMSVVVTVVCGNVFRVAAVVKNSVFFRLGVFFGKEDLFDKSAKKTFQTFTKGRA